LNNGDDKTVYKLNAGPLPDGKGSEGVLVRRGTEFEYQRGLYCERCQLQVSCRALRREFGAAEGAPKGSAEPRYPTSS